MRFNAMPLVPRKSVAMRVLRRAENPVACALTAPAEDALVRSFHPPGLAAPDELLRLPLGSQLEVRYEGQPHLNQRCVFTERVTGDDCRLDLLLPGPPDPEAPDAGDVRVTLLLP